MKRYDTTTYQKKGQAVFLVAMLLLSVVAVSVAFAGGAAATAEVEGTYNDLLAGEQIYQGQDFNITNLNDSSEPAATSFNQPGDGVDQNTDNIHLIEITERSGNTIDNARQVRPLSYDNSTANGQVSLDTSDLEPGEYALSNETGVSGKILTSFTVSEQTFSVAFDDDSVTGQDKTTIELDSPDRPTTSSYNVTISVDGPDEFDADMLDDLFNVTANPGYEVTDSDHLPIDHLGYDDGDGVNDLRDDGYLTLDLNNITEQGLGDLSDDELTAHFDELANGEGLPDGGEYEFELIVADTGVTATDTIQIDESDESASFSAGTYQTAAGDLAEFEFELEDTDETWIQIGDEDSDFVDVLYVKADDDSEPVTVTVNTRLLGTSTTLDGEDVYDVGNADTVESAYHDAAGGAMTNTPDGVTIFEDDGDTTNGNQLDEYVNDLGIADAADEQLTRPLQAATYEMQIAGTDVDNALFDADSGVGEANNQLDTAVLELVSPEIGDITIHTAPEERANDETDIDELVSIATPREEIATDDRLIVQVEATGLYGALVAGAENDAANDVNFDRLEDGVSTGVLHNLLETTNESIDFEISAEETTGNQEPLKVDLENAGDSDAFVLIDNENGQFFVVVDTSSNSAFANGDAPDSDTTFTAELEYDADNDDNRYEFTSDTNPAPFGAVSGTVNYPYLLQGETLSSSADFNLEPRSVDFDNLNVDDLLEAENVEDAEISGTTNVAPGSDATIRVSSTDASSSFRIGQDVTINDDGSVSAMFDFSDQEVGDQFDTSFRIGGSSVDTVDSVLVEAGSLDTAPPEDDTAEDDTDDSADEDADDDSADEDADDGSTADDSSEDADEETDDETPGFGVLVALIALIGAALLAARRQN